MTVKFFLCTLFIYTLMAHAIPHPSLPELLVKPAAPLKQKPPVFSDHTNTGVVISLSAPATTTGGGAVDTARDNSATSIGATQVNHGVASSVKVSKEEALPHIMNVIKSKIEALCKTYHKKKCYFLVKLHFTSKADHQSHTPNKRNVHLHKEVVERNEAGIQRNKGSKIRLVDISCGHDALSDLKDFREEKRTGKRVSTKAKVQYVSHTMKDISVNLLNCAECNEIDSFVYIVGNTFDFNMVPQMYFTSKEMEQFFSDSLKQDPYEVGVCAKAFVVASHKGVARGYGI
ncbi:hypothetical protein K439DRAFT_1612934 [Ramaria rubella]|nr:hypothetical protein K439DRAFT_1612934 [Ramaria rubella]